MKQTKLISTEMYNAIMSFSGTLTEYMNDELPRLKSLEVLDIITSYIEIDVYAFPQKNKYYLKLTKYEIFSIKMEITQDEYDKINAWLKWWRK